jgi:hypothetical protein
MEDVLPQCPRCKNFFEKLGVADGHELLQCPNLACSISAVRVKLENGEAGLYRSESLMETRLPLRRLHQIAAAEVPPFLANRKAELREKAAAEKAARERAEHYAAIPKTTRCLNQLCEAYWFEAPGAFCRHCGRHTEECPKEQGVGCQERSCSAKGRPVDPRGGRHCASCGSLIGVLPLEESAAKKSQKK